tara:strand:+ start:5041 stop:5235 length:195 start_codon:yes stop_codon:yes gene_type:complete
MNRPDEDSSVQIEDPLLRVVSLAIGLLLVSGLKGGDVQPIQPILEQHYIKCHGPKKLEMCQTDK